MVPDSQTVMSIIVIAAVALAVGLVAYLRHKAKEKLRRYEAQFMTTAILHEDSEATGSGIFSAALLVLNNIAMPVIIFGGFAGPGALHQVLVALVWVATNQVLIMGLSLGRSRRFIMRQKRPKEPEGE